MELTDKTIQHLIRLAKRETYEDILHDECDGEWEAGYDDGETYLARLVLDDLGVNYND